MSTKLCPFCSEEIKVSAIKCKHCGSMLSGSTSSGSFKEIDLVRQALGDRYEILEEIGRGGMATVFKALQRNLDRVVALKVIHQHLLHDEEFVARFHREAKICASLSHPNIITVYDEGELGGMHFMALEYLEGMDLGQLIRQLNQLSPRKTLQCLMPVVEALAYAHEQGLIHRDIKSSNIFIKGDLVTNKLSAQRIVLTDFGIAHAKKLGPFTVDGEVIGTLEYMSPEQADGRKVDHRTDLYSLGVVMYECLTGSLPFEGETAANIIHQVIYDSPPERRLNMLSKPMRNLVMSLLDKEPARRPGTAGELASAMRQLLNEENWEPSSRSDRYTFSEQSSQSGKKRKKNPAIVWFLVLMGIVLAVLLVDQLTDLASDKDQNGKETTVAAEDQIWQNAQHANTISSYDGYLQKYPNGKYTSQARTRKRELEHQEAERERQQQLAVQQREQQAQRQRELELERDRQRRLEEQQARQAEDRAWLRAQNTNTVASYNSYLNDFPDGRYASEARSGRDNLERESQESAVQGREYKFQQALETLIAEDQIFTVVDDQPIYPGGEEARIRYLQENLRYPQMAREAGIQGTVFVTFVVERDGSITDFSVLRGIGGGCDEEAIRVVRNMPRWIPGRQKGQPVRVQYNMPIRFTSN